MPGRTWPTLTEDQILELRRLHRVARKVSGTMPPEHPDRRVSETFTAMLADYVEAGIPKTELARAIKVRPDSIRGRLVRHGYLKPCRSELRRYRNEQIAYGGRTRRVT